MILVPDDDPDSSSSLGPHHFGHKGAVSSLYEGQLAPDLLVVLDEAAGGGGCGGDQRDGGVSDLPAGGEHCRVGLQSYIEHPDCRSISHLVSEGELFGFENLEEDVIRTERSSVLVISEGDTEILLRPCNCHSDQTT